LEGTVVETLIGKMLQPILEGIAWGRQNRSRQSTLRSVGDSRNAHRSDRFRKALQSLGIRDMALLEMIQQTIRLAPEKKKGRLQKIWTRKFKKGDEVRSIRQGVACLG
jgi:hypothetical protein